ncbi:MAG: GNAT family N-acetyltransferase, partial [Pseudomonadota bacterium]
GALLVMDSLEEATRLGWHRVLLVGDEPYYRRFGFRRALAVGLDFPRPINFDRLLARELVPKAMADVTGTVVKWVEAN